MTFRLRDNGTREQPAVNTSSKYIGEGAQDKPLVPRTQFPVVAAEDVDNYLTYEGA